MAVRPIFRATLALIATLALLCSWGCFPGDLQLSKLEQDKKQPVPTKNAATKATPHNYGAPPPLIFTVDAGGGG